MTQFVHLVDMLLDDTFCLKGAMGIVRLNYMIMYSKVVSSVYITRWLLGKL